MFGIGGPFRRRISTPAVHLLNEFSVRRHGREKLHFINPVPINSIAERWISKFEAPRLNALFELKRTLEGKDHG